MLYSVLSCSEIKTEVEEEEGGFFASKMVFFLEISKLELGALVTIWDVVSISFFHLGRIFPFLPLLNCISILQFLFSFLLPFFSPVPLWGVSKQQCGCWPGSSLPNTAQTPKKVIEGSNSSTLWFCGNGAH